MNSRCRFSTRRPRHDVDRRTGQLAGKADVLAAAADRQAELIVGHDHLDPALLLVDHDAGDGGRLERVDDEGGQVRRPGDDVDLLALHLLHDAWTRLPFMPTQAPTGSIELSWLITPILARLPGSRAAALISMMPS
jgi:hypothetical protein